MLREQRNQAVGGKSELTGCPYHRTDKGCILGDIKAPICIQHFDNQEEWRERFKINAGQLRGEIGHTLVAILNGLYLNRETFPKLQNLIIDTYGTIIMLIKGIESLIFYPPVTAG